MKDYFQDSELTCKCGCHSIIKPPEGLLRLNYTRLSASIPFILNSATRCKDHNANAGGSKTSDHLYGEGWDVACDSSRNRFLIVESAIKAGITRIGIGKEFVHLGVHNLNPQEVMWLY